MIVRVKKNCCLTITFKHTITLKMSIIHDRAYISTFYTHIYIYIYTVCKVYLIGKFTLRIGKVSPRKPIIV